jgi:hypothetical protein
VVFFATENKKGDVLDHAFNNSNYGFDHDSCYSLAYKPIHPPGGLHQEDFECRLDYCRCLMAPEGFLDLEFPLQHRRGEITPLLVHKKTI